MNPGNNLLLGSAYFPPVSYFSAMAGADRIYIENHDSYIKQSYRNRCVIMGPNEIQKLVIPVKKTGPGKCLLKDIQVDYDTDWQRLHRRSISAAYSSSPFYMHYMEEYLPFFEGKTKFLADLNFRILEVLLRQTGIRKKIQLTDSFERDVKDTRDLREILHPKKSAESSGMFSFREYTQVFGERHGFVANLSIVDLLFNTGPEAILYLKNHG